jgi:hypothetical protein
MRTAAAKTKTKSKEEKMPTAKAASKVKAMPVLAILAGGKLTPASRKEMGKPEASELQGRQRVGKGKKH